MYLPRSLSTIQTDAHLAARNIDTGFIVLIVIVGKNLFPGPKRVRVRRC